MASRGPAARRRRLAAEHQQMRRQPTLGAARHDDGDTGLDLGHWAFQALGQQELQASLASRG